jgi:hypothetical protein
MRAIGRFMPLLQLQPAEPFVIPVKAGIHGSHGSRPASV